MRLELERLRQLDYLCDRDLAAAGAELTVRIPAWNKLGGVMARQFGGTIKRAARLEVDIELTTRVLAWRSTRGAGQSGFERSVACPDDRWDYRVTDDEGVSIAFSRELNWPDMPGFDLPTRFKSGP